MKIISVNRNTIDVFTGEGWENWSRFKLTKHGPKLISGQKLSNENFSNLTRLVKVN